MLGRSAESNGATLVLVAHGTRSRHGIDMISALAAEVRKHVHDVRVAFVDVLGPSPVDVLRDCGDDAVLVPAFLASGYHVYTDVPRDVEESGHETVAVTRALGPDPVLAGVVARRLRTAGWRPGDTVVMAVAGSSDRRARQDARQASAMLSEVIGQRVHLANVATGTPKVADVVAALRTQGHRQVFIASYLLAHGLFQQRLHDAGADGVADPIGPHEDVAALIVARYLSGCRELARRVRSA